MYFNPPPQTSPAINHKLQSHHDAWGRPTHQHQHHVLAGANGVGPPTPGYTMYANGALPHHAHPHLPQHPPLQHAHSQHHHQNSLTHPSFSSPPNGVAMQQAHALTASPPSSVQLMSQHWQQQLLKYDMVRASRSPHHRARQNAIASRPAAKSAITITDPNRVKTPAEGKDGDGSGKEIGQGSPEDHPSSTTAPIAPAPRTSHPQTHDNSWSSLDMGGINLKNIPPSNGLWSFTFLQNLYLNHNALQSVPPQIAHLRHLELLDLSGNLLQSVPPELGMVTTLKELYLFDNHLVTLPFELGTLHQLRTIGIEGNPLSPELKDIVQREGTHALIAYLRNAAPIPDPPPQRAWRSMQSDVERQTQDADPAAETLSVLCYNILCERCATEQLYGYTPKRSLEWGTRKDLILDEIQHYNSDFICLQEVDVAQYEDFFLPHLSENGYEGVYWPKSRANTMEETKRRLVDGCATFFKSSK